jgi:hypothetical protein
MKEAMMKVYAVIESCKTPAEIETAGRMLKNYNKMYGHSVLLNIYYKQQKQAIANKELISNI